MALVLALPVSGFAQAKIKIAIWEVENHAESYWWFHNDMGPAARNTIDSEFSENKLLSDKFSIVERDKLNLVMKEQGLGAGRRARSADGGQGRQDSRRQVHPRRRHRQVQHRRRPRAAVGAFGVGGSLVAGAGDDQHPADRHDDRRARAVAAGRRRSQEGRRLLQGHQHEPRHRMGSRERDDSEGVESDRREVRCPAATSIRLSTAATPAGGLEGQDHQGRRRPSLDQPGRVRGVEGRRQVQRVQRRRGADRSGHRREAGRRREADRQRRRRRSAAAVRHHLAHRQGRRRTRFAASHSDLYAIRDTSCVRVSTPPCRTRASDVS